MKNQILFKKVLATITFSIIIIILLSNSIYWASIILFIILINFLFTNNKEFYNLNKKRDKSKKLNRHSMIRNIGMYNMKKSETYDNQLLKNIHYFLGVTFQGRFEEFENLIWEILNEKTIYGVPINNNIQNIFIENKDRLITACKIAKKYDDKIGYDLKESETIGEYFDRKIEKNKKFMEIFTYINNIDFEKEIHKNDNIVTYTGQKVKQNNYDIR